MLPLEERFEGCRFAQPLATGWQGSALHGAGSLRKPHRKHIRVPHREAQLDGLTGETAQVTAVLPFYGAFDFVADLLHAIVHGEARNQFALRILDLHRDAAGGAGGEVDDELAARERERFRREPTAEVG